MFKIKINDRFDFEVNGGKELSVDNRPFNWDIQHIREGRFNVLIDNKSYDAEVVRADYASKSFTIKINSNIYQISVKDQYDQLLEKLGINNLTKSKVNEITAPMPGLVLDIMVQEGKQLSKNEAVLVLEAMKMENVLKSPGKGKIKKIFVNAGDAVEKDQVLVELE